MQARIERLANAPRHGVLQNPKTCSHMDVDYVGHCHNCGAYFDGSVAKQKGAPMLSSGKRQWQQSFSLEVENRRLKGKLCAEILLHAHSYLHNRYFQKELHSVTSYGGFGYTVRWTDEGARQASGVISDLMEKVNVNEVVAVHPKKLYRPY
jgi:hypothetical protein